MRWISSLLFLIAAPGFANSLLVYMLEKDDSKHIILADDAGETIRSLTSGNEWHLYPSINSQGTKVAYVAGPDAQNLKVMIHDLETDARSIVSTKAGMHLHPTFSGDGQTIAYTAPSSGDTHRIQIIDQWDQETIPTPREIASAGAAYFPALSSDGSFVVYQVSTTDEDGQSHKAIVEFDLIEGEKKLITPADGYAMAPSLSFDDRWITYTRRENEKWDLYVYDRFNDKITRVTRHAARDFAPTFHPDGSLIFASDRRGPFQLYRISRRQMNLGTFRALPFVTGPGDHYAPSFSGTTDLAAEQAPSMMEPPRSSFGLVRLGDRLYVAGGHKGAEHTYPPESFMANLEAYDLKTQTWVSLPPRPRAAHGYGLAASDRYLYAFGGFAYDDQGFVPRWRSLDEIDRYDPETNEWTTVGQLPRRRSSNVVATVGDTVYLLGGWDATPSGPKDFEGTFHREIDAFDLSTEQAYQTRFRLPNPLRRALSGVVHDGRIYLVGGLGQGATHFELLDNITSFHPATGIWRERGRLPFPTFAPAAGFLRGRLTVFGGMFKTGPLNYIYVNHIFQQKGRQFLHTGRYLRESKGFSQVAEVDGGLAVLGGHHYFTDGTDSPIGTFEIFR